MYTAKRALAEKSSILGSEVRKSLWSAWVHSNAIDREKATAADLPCELIADCSVHGGLSYPSRRCTDWRGGSSPLMCAC